jgi:mannosyltransferase OCH1-like enzyme
MLLIVTSVCITWGNFQALNGHSQIRDDVAILPLIQVPLKTFLQVQKERGVQVPQNLSQMDQLQYDFQQVESYWKNHTLTAAEMAERYNIPETRRPECVPDSKTKVGWIPCRDCNREGDHGRIPKVIFQSWKSIDLDSRICGMAVSWTEVNPEYDYLLFDDDIILRMIELVWDY